MGVKKEKKSKEEDSLQCVSESPLKHESKKKKKAKKNKDETSHTDNLTATSMEISQILSMGDDSPVKKKKKKKKHKEPDQESCEEAMSQVSSRSVGKVQSPTVNDDEEPPKKKKKKKRCPDDESEINSIDVLLPTENGDQNHSEKKKKKKSKHVADSENLESDTPPNGGKHKKKKKDKRVDKRSQQCEISPIKHICDSAEELSEHPKQKTKKCKKRKLHEHDNNEAEDCVQSLNSKKRKGKYKPGNEEDVTSVATELERNSDDNRKSKKKDKKKLEEANFDAVCEPDNTHVEKKRKKKEKKDKVRQDVEDDVANVENQSDNSSESKSQKKKSKKRKHKKESSDDEGQDTEVNGLTSTETNMNAPAASYAGQWQTASFENSDRQNKFLRLLGGFKKGSSEGAAAKKEQGLLGKKLLWGSAPKVGGNMALSNTQEADMNAKLEEQFEKARVSGVGKQKGLGLGFEPPPGEGKKFYIDTKSSASMKFDD